MSSTHSRNPSITTNTPSLSSGLNVHLQQQQQESGDLDSSSEEICSALEHLNSSATSASKATPSPSSISVPSYMSTSPPLADAPTLFKARQDNTVAPLTSFYYCFTVLYKTACNPNPPTIQSNSDKRNSEGGKKEFLLSIVSFISCPINVEGLPCIKAEKWKCFLYPNVLSEFDCITNNRDLHYLFY